MRTTLPAEKLVALHAKGQAQTGPFVNPHTIVRCQRILSERGQDWAASVLLRNLDRRSLINPNFPWLNSGEEETLVLADKAEWEQLESALQ